MSGSKTTRRAKILIAIDSDGKWVSAGYDDGDGTGDNPMEWIMIDDLGAHLSYHWIEADIPVPVQEIIEGDVTDAS